MTQDESAPVVWRAEGTDIGVAIMARGGKIASLTGPDGHEWLAQAAGPIPVDPTPVFTDAEMCGWDECAPTITPCRQDGIDYPDHGELWANPWELVESDATSCALAFTSPRGDYRLERRASVTGSTLAITYCVTALGRPIYWFWTSHPQFAVGEGAFITWAGQGAPIADTDQAGAPLKPWDPDFARIGTLPQHGSRKFYLNPAEFVASAQIHDDGRVLQMSWNKGLPYLGFWMERSRFARTDIIALEPSVAYYDDLSLAVGLGTAPLLPPGRPYFWDVKVCFEGVSS